MCLYKIWKDDDVLMQVVYLRVRRSHYIAARRAFLLEQAQKEPHSEGNFEKEFAKVNI